MDISLIVSGVLVGIVIGATGMGGGLIMTPLLMFGFGVAPSIAVGTDLIFASVTKIFGAWQHWRQKTIDFKLLKNVALGSIPGTLVGIFVLRWAKTNLQIPFDVFISKALGIVFLIIAVVMVLQIFKKQKTNTNRQISNMNPLVVGIIGLLVGFLVAITSVGSGTLFIALLLFLYPYAASRLVGTDIIHGVLITGIAAMAHITLGTIDLLFAGKLLVGSIPGVLIGSKLSIKLPDRYIKFLLVCLLAASALKLL